MAYDNGLTPAQIELLDMLQEEAAEVIQIVAKLKRHGPMSYHPADAEKTPNYILMARELGDMIGVMAALDEKGMIDNEVIEQYAATKMDRAAPYLHHQ